MRVRSARLRAKKKMLWLGGSGFILLLLVVILYLYLEPTRHFQPENITIVAAPDEAYDVASAPGGPADRIYLKLLTLDGLEREKEDRTTAEKENRSFTILLLGLDAREEEASRTDVIMLVNLNPQRKTANIVSIPRDTRVEVSGTGNTKINHVHFLAEERNGSQEATQAVLQTVSRFCDCAIHYFVKTDLQGFTHFVDMAGGIDITLPQSVTLTFSDKTLPAGEQHLDGETALALVRERYSLPDGDFGRQENQALVLQTLADKLLQRDQIWKIPALLKQVKEDVIDANLGDSDLISLAWMFQGMDMEDIHYLRIPGKGEYLDDPLLKKPLYFWIPNMEEVRKISQEYLKN